MEEDASEEDMNSLSKQQRIKEFVQKVALICYTIP